MSTEIDGQLPALRTDIHIAADPGDASRGRYLLHDGSDQRVWQVGARERAILTLLDGNRTIAALRDALVEQKLVPTDGVPSADEILNFASQLARESLLVPGEVTEALKRRSGGRSRIRRTLTFPVRWVLRWLVVTPWKILSLESRPDLMQPTQWRFGSPDRLLSFLAGLFRPLLGRAGVVAATAYLLLGIGLLMSHFDQWWEAVDFLWNPWGVVVIALVGILVVHIPHQLAHGVVLVHHGARAPSWGLKIAMHVVPTFWIDAADAVWLPEKNSRMAVMAAGPLWQGLCFTSGLIGWLITSRGTTSLLFLALSSTALFGLMLNANPLARRDCYHLLSTWLELSNLRERASAYLDAWVRWQPMPEPYTRRERRWFGVYSLAARGFGLVLTIGAVLFGIQAMHQYRETGATFVVFVAGFLFQDHFRSLMQSTPLARARRWVPRFVMWTLWIAFAGVVAWGLFLPYPYHAGGETILASLEQVEIRTELEGMIGDIAVQEGAWVEKGQTIAMLHSQVQERNLYAAQAQLAESKAKQSALVAGMRPEEIERARSAVLTAQAQLDWSTGRALRYKPLYEQKVISAQEYENAQQAQMLDQRRLEEARAALTVVEIGTRKETIEASHEGIKSQQAIVAHFQGNVQRTAISSPISGYVTTPDIQNLRGRYLQPGQRDLIATIENTKVLVAAIEVPQEDISGVSVGGEVTLYTWSYPGRAFKGTVSAISPVASDDNPAHYSYVRVTTHIPNADGILKPKMTGYAKIMVTHRPVWDVLFRPLLRWARVELWSWLP